MLMAKAHWIAASKQKFFLAMTVLVNIALVS